jgi:predicted nucleic acid-binding protein
MIVLDASVVIAYFNAAERSHTRVAGWLETLEEQLVTTPLVLAELDYVLARRAGPAALDALWSDLEDGVYEVRWWAGALTATIGAARAAPIRIGLADASLVALAAHLGTTRIATLDEAHFRRLDPLGDADAFVLLPADGPAT